MDVVRYLFDGLVDISFVEADKPLGPGYSARVGMNGLANTDSAVGPGGFADTLFFEPDD